MADCVVMLTDRWNDRLERHFERLKREASPVLPVFLAAHTDGSGPLPGADVSVSLNDAAARWPVRHRALLDEKQKDLKGYLDLIWLTAFLDPRLAAFDRFWLIEHDVDFSGNWATLFAEAATIDADLLATHIRERRDQPVWHFGGRIVDPTQRTDDHLLAFFPVSRLSRRLIEHLRRELSVPGWKGHFELIFPTLARRGGFTIEDLGGSGDFTPPARRNRFYEGTFRALQRGFYTHAFRPPRLGHYLVESRSGFSRPDSIYHPIKRGAWWLHILWDMVIVRDRLRVAIARMRGREPQIRKGMRS